MDRMLQDIRYAFRQLRSAPAFLVTAVLTLAFGIGATTAIFSIVEGVLLRPLPFAQPSRLVVLGDKIEGLDLGNHPHATVPEMSAYARGTHAFASMGGYKYASYALSGIGDAAQINGERLTAGVFPTLGVAPSMGRWFTQQEDDGRAQVAVISYQMWRSRFHGDMHVIGRRVLLARKPYEVIGVMPRDFEFPIVPGQLNQTELWVPMSLTPEDLDAGSSSRWDCEIVGRLKPGVTVAQAQQDLEPATQEVMRNLPQESRNVSRHALVGGLQEATVAQARPLLRMLFLAVTAVLFIACVNLAGVLLVRVVRGRRAIAIRLALGAGRKSVVKQYVLETLLLSAMGGILGLLFADTALQLGVKLLPESLPRIAAIGLDWSAAAAAVGLTLLTAVLCGVVPAATAARTGLNEALKEAGRIGSGGAGHARLRSALVVAEIAAALVLLTGAGLLIGSFMKMRSVDVGFKTDHMLTAAYALPEQEYSTQAAVDAFDTGVVNKLRQMPGVQSVGMVTSLPLSAQAGNWNSFVPEGYVPNKGEGMIQGWAARVVGGDYFAAAGIPVVRGRSFNDADSATSPIVAIVNRKLAERYWPGQDPIGKRLHFGLSDTPIPWMTVIGEIGDVKETTADAETKSQIYTLARQSRTMMGKFASPNMVDGEFGSIAIRSQLPPEQMISGLRGAVRSIDPQLPLKNIESMDEIVHEGQASRRFNSLLVSSFALAAVLLAMLGVYSVIAFSAATRTQEMAIRLALGSQRSSVLGLVLSWGAKLGAIGCVLGAGAALLVTRLLRSLLFEVDPLNPWVLTLAVLAILLLGLAASFLPARRAAAMDPMQALRAE